MCAKADGTNSDATRVELQLPRTIFFFSDGLHKNENSIT
jgi:hypothetical protein